MKWINWVVFVFAWLMMFAGANSLYYAMLGLWLFLIFFVVVILERISNLEKDFNIRLSDYNSVILMRINETHKKENKKKDTWKCSSCRHFFRDKYGRYCSKNVELFRARCTI